MGHDEYIKRLAAGLREAYHADMPGETMAFDELKPEVRARWERVAGAAAQEILGDQRATAEYVGELEARIKVLEQPAAPTMTMEEALYESVRDCKERRSGFPLEHAVRAVRARVEAPLLAEINSVRNKLASANRKIERQAAELTKLYHLRQGDAGERRGLESELVAVSQERDRLAGWYEGKIGSDEVADRKLLRKRLDVPAGEWPTKYIFAALDERDALRAELDAAQAECKHLNAIICERQPIDPDAWKTPLFIDACGDEDGDKLTAIENGFRIIHVGECDWEYSAEDARAFAVWLASYAAAHGCPVGLGVAHEPTAAEVEALARVLERQVQADGGADADTLARAAFAHFGAGAPIASADTLEQLADLIYRIDCDHCELCDWAGLTDTAKNRYRAQVAAILRAAQAYVDVTPNELSEARNSYTYGSNPTPNQDMLNWLNSRIRYRVALPETPKGLPSVNELEAVFDAGRDDGALVNAKGIEAILTTLRPWIHEPTGWELDVTWQEVQAAYYRHQSGSPEGQCWHQVIDLLRSSIRPTFGPCKECAKRPKNVVNAFNFTFDYDTGSWKVINIAPENAS